MERIVRPLVVDLGREFRGGQNQALLLLKGLRDRGHAPELVAVRDSDLARRASETGIPVRAVAAGRRRIAAALTIRNIVRAGRVDLVHANEPHALTAAWLARAHRSVPLVVARRIALPLSSHSLSLARYRAAARVIAISHFVKESAIRSGLPESSCAVVYDGVQIPTQLSAEDRLRARREFGIPPAAPCMGNVAAFVPEKGHVILIRAFANLRGQFPECVLLLRGEGAGRDEALRLVRQMQLDNAVRFAANGTEIGTVLAALDVFAFSSHEEPLGSAMLAAMAHGLPVVAFARGGIPEAVEDKKTGRLVDRVDPDEFSAALSDMVANPEMARRLGACARKTVIERFSDGEMVAATFRVYEGIMRQ